MRCAGAPNALSFQPGAAHAGAHSLDDQIAFEFRDGTDDDHHGPAQRSASVNVFPELTNSRPRWLSSSSTSRK